MMPKNHRDLLTENHKPDTTMFDNVRDLAIAIAGILGSDDDHDFDAIEDWLTHNDDGSDEQTLADRFDMEEGLPSRKSD